ncbi:MAG: hypothetical protein WC028_12135 [Candidatus Obscuribacterales bacterium]
MDNIDIPKLTNEAEEGKGCLIREKIREMPFEESLQTLKAIQEQNENNRDLNSSLPSLSMDIEAWRDTTVYAKLKLKDHWWSPPQTITTDGISIETTSAQRSQSCTDRQ